MSTPAVLVEGSCLGAKQPSALSTDKFMLGAQEAFLWNLCLRIQHFRETPKPNDSTYIWHIYGPIVTKVF